MAVVKNGFGSVFFAPKTSIAIYLPITAYLALIIRVHHLYI